MSEKEVIEMKAEENRKRADLELLIDDNTGSKTTDLTGKRDRRFVTDGDNEFAVDPTHKEYRKVT